MSEINQIPENVNITEPMVTFVMEGCDGAIEPQNRDTAIGTLQTWHDGRGQMPESFQKTFPDLAHRWKVITEGREIAEKEAKEVPEAATE